MRFNANSTLGAALAAAVALKDFNPNDQSVTATGTAAALQVVAVPFEFASASDLLVETVVTASGVRATLASSAYTVFPRATRDTDAGLYTGVNDAAIPRSVVVTDAVAATSTIVVTHRKPRVQVAPGAGLSELVGSLGNVVEGAVGEYTGTQAAADIVLPFDPYFVFINNKTDGDTAGYAIRTTNLGTTSQTIVALTAQIASAGILFGALGTKKFSLGSNAVVNETAKVFQYIALGW